MRYSDYLMLHLRDIANVRSGYPFRGAVEPMPGGGCRLLQMSDFGPLGLVEGGLEIEPPPGCQTHRLRQGDVLLVGRGTRNFAAVYPHQAETAVAAGHMFVLRPKPEVDPMYLAWFLNEEKAQGRLKRMQLGSGLRFIPKESLMALRVPLPALEVQHRIVQVYLLGLEEEALMEMLRRARKRLVQAALRKAALGKAEATTGFEGPVPS
jgi:hypothetical protein